MHQPVITVCSLCVCVCVCVGVCKLIDGIVPRKGPNACFFKISLILEVSSKHCYLRTENRSICHGVVNFILAIISTQGFISGSINSVH